MLNNKKIAQSNLLPEQTLQFNIKSKSMQLLISTFNFKILYFLNKKKKLMLDIYYMQHIWWKGQSTIDYFRVTIFLRHISLLFKYLKRNFSHWTLELSIPSFSWVRVNLSLAVLLQLWQEMTTVQAKALNSW